MSLVIWYVIVVILGSLITGIAKSILGIKIHSDIKYGVVIFRSIDNAVTLIIGYCLISAILGHWVL